MKILRNILCIIYIIIYKNFNKFVTYSLRHSRNEIYKKILFLNSNNFNKNKNIYNYKNVYNNKWDSLIKSTYSGPNYTDFVKANQIVEIPKKPLNLKNILSIETSFDNTCLAIVRGDGSILSEVNQSQPDIIEKYGGLRPYSSKEAHEQTIELLFNEVIKRSGLKIDDIDEIAVTRGPGIELCLRVGYNFGLNLSKKYNIPLVSENHIAAHCLTPMIRDHQFKYINSEYKKLRYPYLSLLLSGAHGQIYLVENPTKFHLMCDTIDQFPGSVLDKCARMLGLEIKKGGGPELEKASSRAKTCRFGFTVPMVYNNQQFFCFSGIQTQLSNILNQTLKKYNVKTPKELPRTIVDELAFVSQKTVFDVIMNRVKSSISISETFFPTKQLAVVGGVASNEKLKNMINDYLYLRDESVVFNEQEVVFNRVKKSIKRFTSDMKYNFLEDNPYKKMFFDFKERVKSIEDYIHYLCNPDFMPDLLIPGNVELVSSEFKNELHRSLLDLYFELIGNKGLTKISYAMMNASKTDTIVKPSQYILNLIRKDRRTPNPIVIGGLSGQEPWELITTTKKYCTDNAVMIGFSLIEKHKMGISGMRNPDRIDNRDVLSRWNLGPRIYWEILSDICKMDALLNYKLN